MSKEVMGRLSTVTQWPVLFGLFVAGGLGTVTRYGITLWGAALSQRWHATAPFVGTLAVNIIGSFALGILFALVSRKVISAEVKIVLATGFFGGFTTFSAFALDTVEMSMTGKPFTAAAYVGISVGVSVLAAYLGTRLVGHTW